MTGATGCKRAAGALVARDGNGDVAFSGGHPAMSIAPTRSSDWSSLTGSRDVRAIRWLSRAT
jgi:hypothetical protein